MIPKTHLNAIKIIHERIYRTSISWAFTGSVNMALQGLAVTPNDIDIITDEEGAHRIVELLAEFEVEPIALKQVGDLRSQIGVFEFEGVKVEVIAELESKSDAGDWSAAPSYKKAYMSIVYINLKAPILDLEYELEIYKLLERDEKIKKIERYLGY
jgi:hypothetical protein